MTVLRGAMLVLAKDLRIELRTREVTLTTVFFAVLVAVLASLSFFVDDQVARKLAPGVLWIAIEFAGVLAISRTWSRERDAQVLRAVLLSPMPRNALYVGKALGTLLFLAIVEVVLVPIVAVLFHLDLIPVLGPVALVLALGTAGFVIPGALFGAMTVRARAGDFVLSSVLFTLSSPALLMGVQATRMLLLGEGMRAIAGSVQLLIAFDVAFLLAGLWLFEPLVAD